MKYEMRVKVFIRQRIMNFLNFMVTDTHRTTEIRRNYFFIAWSALQDTIAYF